MCLYNKKEKKTVCFCLIFILIIVVFTGCMDNYTKSSETVDMSEDYKECSLQENNKENIQEDNIDDNYVDNNAEENLLENTQESKDGQSEEQRNIIEITMLDVGQGLCLLVGLNNHYLMYDGGGRSASSYVVNYLQKRDIRTLDYMIVSHYDEDHISGLIGVMNTLEVQEALLPDYDPDTKIYNSFMTMIENKKISTMYPKVGEQYKMDEIIIEILAPENYEDMNENNRSIVVRLTYQDFSCLFMGDAEKEEESYILSLGKDISADLYVVGHHGSASSNDDAFWTVVNPKYGFISVGKDNEYGHPAASLIKKMQKKNIELFRSDLNGVVSMYYDGKNASFMLEKIASIEDNNEMQSENVVIEEDSDRKNVTYVLNINSKKFHLPSCESVEDIKEYNRVDTNRCKEDIIEDGYIPCKRCNP